MVRKILSVNQDGSLNISETGEGVMIHMPEKSRFRVVCDILKEAITADVDTDRSINPTIRLYSILDDLLSGEWLEGQVTTRLSIALVHYCRKAKGMEVDEFLDYLVEFLEGKNKAYGDSAFKPINVFSQLTAEESIFIRMDDKISRMVRGDEYAGDDTPLDLLGYLVLLDVLRMGERMEEIGKEYRKRMDSRVLDAKRDYTEPTTYDKPPKKKAPYSRRWSNPEYNTKAKRIIQIIKMRAANNTYQEIADELGCGMATVCTYLQTFYPEYTRNHRIRKGKDKC